VNFVAGLDLGQTADWSALVVAEHLKRHAGFAERRIDYNNLVGAYFTHQEEQFVDEYHVRGIWRWRGTAYTAVIDQVCDILRKPPLRGCTALTYDETGLGRPVGDLLDQAVREGRLERWPHGLTITAGQYEGTDRPIAHFAPGFGMVAPSRLRTVPKAALVQRIEVLLQSGRLLIADSLPLAPALKEELLTFQAVVRATGHVSYEAASGNDDLVLGLALAVYQEPVPLGIPSYIGGDGRLVER
jgi:hypothetical protein